MQFDFLQGIFHKVLGFQKYYFGILQAIPEITDLIMDSKDYLKMNLNYVAEHEYDAQLMGFTLEDFMRASKFLPQALVQVIYNLGILFLYPWARLLCI